LQKSGTYGAADYELSETEMKLYDLMSNARREISAKAQLPAYTIFVNKTLQQMAKLR
jgi:hypothetical protein